jgi:hypothetical protein
VAVLQFNTLVAGGIHELLDAMEMVLLQLPKRVKKNN